MVLERGFDFARGIRIRWFGLYAFDREEITPASAKPVAGQSTSSKPVSKSVANGAISLGHR
jgi:hypothetical protein